MYIVLGIMIPLIGTTLGSLLVYFIRDDIKPLTKKIILAFSSGIMISSAIWSLLIPSVEMTGNTKCKEAYIGFILGLAFIIILSIVKPKKLKNTYLFSYVVALHNIPEGMAVGVMFASCLNANSGVLIMDALMLSIGIAIQNIPEGTIISVPLYNKNNITKNKAFFYGFLSGIVEPIFSLITILLIKEVSFLLPYFLAFAASNMLYVVFEELIPEYSENNNSKIPIIFLNIGFLLMMFLDNFFK